MHCLSCTHKLHVMLIICISVYIISVFVNAYGMSALHVACVL